jgi:hypothetical protein
MTRVGRTVLCALVVAVNGWATLIPGPDLARQIDESDAIVVAKVRSGTTTSAGERISSNFVLRVERVLKGAVVPGTDIHASLEGRGDFIYPQTSVRPVPDFYGIWFLKSGTGAYSVVSRAPNHGELHIALTSLPDGAAAPMAGKTPAESVLNELVSSLRWLAAAHRHELKPTRHVETAGDRRVPSFTFGRFGSEFVALAESLRTLPAETVHIAYRQLAEEQSPHLRSLAIAGLTGLNDPEGPKRAAAEFESLSKSVDVNPIVQSVMGYHNASDAGAVRAVAQLAAADASNAGLPENASYSLRVLHTKDAMPALVALLDSDEAAVRANALAGICLFIRNAATVTPDAVRTMAWMTSHEPTPFRSPDTDRYCWMGGMPDEAARLTGHVQFWKAWWREHAAEVMAER